VEKELSQVPLKVLDVTKTYPLKNKSDLIALNNISLEIQSGEIFGLLGPNGAGKTTLINCIVGLLPINQGSIHVFGYDVVRDYVQARSKIGFVYQEVALDNFFKPALMLNFHRGMNGKPFDSKYVEKLLKQLDLWQYKDKLPDQLSGGMKRRLAIAKALVHKPDLVILDEPTAGVDIEARDAMWEIIREINQQGVTILLTTHNIEEAEAISNRVGIINHGTFIKVAPPKQLVSDLGQRRLRVILSKHMTSDLVKSAPFVNKLKIHTGTNNVIHEIFIGRGSDEVTQTLNWFQNQGQTILDVELKQPTLEEVFKELAWGNGNNT
jgi:ABC-2 type transport system ATP-binding protein